MIIDDPVKGRAEADSEIERAKTFKWYLTVARTRLSPGGGLVICQTRWHEDDLSGKLLEMARADLAGDQWKVYSFPAIATQDEKHRKKGEALHPARFSVRDFEKLRAGYFAAGEAREWNALYMGDPTPSEGNYFQRATFKTYKPSTLKLDECTLYLASDFAVGEKTGNDYTVLAPFAVDRLGDIYFLPDTVHARLSSLAMVEQLLDLAHKYHVRQIAIEKGVISHAVMPMLSKRMNERRQFFSLWEKTPSRDKQARATSLRARMQQGKVFFPDCILFHAVWQPEMLAFPAGKHDDLVDACSWAALMLDELISPSLPPPPPEPPPEDDTWDAIQARIPKNFAKTHRPQSLFAHRRKP